MSKYIKLDDAIDGKCPFEDVWEDCIDCPLDNKADEPCKMGKWLKSLPTIDIVRCGECEYCKDELIEEHMPLYIYCEKWNHETDFDDYCSAGESINIEQTIETPNCSECEHYEDHHTSLACANCPVITKVWGSEDERSRR